MLGAVHRGTGMWVFLVFFNLWNFPTHFPKILQMRNLFLLIQFAFADLYFLKDPEAPTSRER